MDNLVTSNVGLESADLGLWRSGTVVPKTLVFDIGLFFQFYSKVIKMSFFL